MNRTALPVVLFVAVACGPSYKSGETQCSDAYECPSGYICGDDGLHGANVCFDNGVIQCDAAYSYYCAETNLCWETPVVCSTIRNCGTTAAPDYRACTTPGMHPDCAGDCVADVGGSGGTGGAGGRGGGGGSGGSGGTGGSGGALCASTPVTPFCSAQMTDACETCIWGACCGPATACLGDVECSESFTGPTWDPYIDCVMDCCFAACVDESSSRRSIRRATVDGRRAR